MIAILASNGREAARIAAMHSLRRKDWMLLTDASGRGTTGLTVWRTRCWWHGRDFVAIQNIEANILIGRMEVVDVQCPETWVTGELIEDR